MRPLVAILAPPAMTFGLAACFVMNGLVAEQGDGGSRKPSDDDTEGDGATAPTGDGSTPTTGGCDVNAPFTQFTPLSELNTAADEELPRLTRDELTIYYFSELDDGGSAAHVAERNAVGSPFGAPTALLPTLSNARAPSPASSPLRLYFSEGDEGWSVRLAERAAPKDAFAASKTVLPAGTLETFGFPATFDGPNGASGMFFVKWTYKNAQDQVGQADVWQGDVDATGGLGNTRAVGGGINTADVELDPTPSADGLTLYFYSDHGLPSGQGRVWITTRASTDVDFGAPRMVSEIAVPAAGWVSPSFFSTDRCRLYFYKADTTEANADLFVANRAAGSPP